MDNVRLIDANALRKRIIKDYRKEFFGSVLWNILDDMPTIDAVPVRHGMWVEIGADKRGRGGIFRCTNCNDCHPHTSKRCSNCGAIMGGVIKA